MTSTLVRPFKKLNTIARPEDIPVGRIATYANGAAKGGLFRVTKKIFIRFGENNDYLNTFAYTLDEISSYSIFENGILEPEGTVLTLTT